MKSSTSIRGYRSEIPAGLTLEQADAWRNDNCVHINLGSGNWPADKCIAAAARHGILFGLSAKFLFKNRRGWDSARII